MTSAILVPAGTLSLPVGVLRTLHYGVSEVRLYRNVVTDTLQVGKRVSLLGRENTLMVEEAALLRSIRHDNVADIYEVAEPVGSDPALAIYEIMMPYYQDGSVYDAMVTRGERFAPGQARDLAVAALRGLNHLHVRHGVLHRDVKPGNLFLTGDRHLVKIGDLGEAVRIDPDGSAEPLITPRFWTPPEAFQGQHLTAESDIFSMGMTLKEMLAGPYPYDNYSIDLLTTRLIEGRVAVLPRDMAFPSHVPGDLRRVVRKATRVTPAERYRSCEEMIDALLRARFIDWNWPTVGDDEVEWVGDHRSGRYRVHARKVRGVGWRARGERASSTGWRRVSGCQHDASGLAEAADEAFAHLDTAITKA